jgi:hypothetical protein
MGRSYLLSLEVAQASQPASGKKAGRMPALLSVAVFESIPSQPAGQGLTGCDQKSLHFPYHWRLPATRYFFPAS